MKFLKSSYNANEVAWETSELTFDRDIYILINLQKKGKIVIRQLDVDGKWIRSPVKKHPDTRDFQLRLQVSCRPTTIKIFTSTEPKEIKYDYISTRHKDRN